MKILITGASGFIASHLALALSKKGHDIVALHNSNSCAAAVAATCEIKQTDLRQKEQVLKLLKTCSPDAIVHAAALTNTNVCQENPAAAEVSNVTATENIVDAASELFQPLPQIIHFSTDLVFEGAAPKPGGFSEDTPAQPISVYAKSKLKSEDIVSKYQGSSTILRTALTYGPPLGNNEGFLGWLRKGLIGEQPVRLFSDEWRTPVYTEDIIAAVSTLLETTRESIPKLLHLGGAERISRLGFGQIFAEVFSFNPSLLKPTSLSDVTFAAPRAPDACLSVNQLRHRLNIYPRDVRDGLLQVKESLLRKGALEHYCGRN